jgi:hypothetical protein
MSGRVLKYLAASATPLREADLTAADERFCEGV